MAGRALVKTALDGLMHDHRWTGEPELRARADVRPILETAGEERRECILELARAGASHINPQRSYVARQVLSMTARRRLALEPGDHRELLELARATGSKRDRGPWIASQLLAAVAKRIEEAAEGWSEEEAAELAPLLEAAAEVVDDQALAGRLRVLLRGGGGLPLELISDEDDVGPRWEAVLTASEEEPAVLAELLEHLASLPASGKPSKRWLAGAEEQRERLADAPALARALLGAMLDAADIEKTFHYESHDYTGTYFLAYRSGNEHLALAIVRLAALTGDPALLEPLRRLAVKAVTVIGGQFGNPRSLKLANAAALSIADMAAPGSITELLALERAIRHGTLLKEIRKAVEALADAQGMTREELLERAVEHHDLARTAAARCR